MLNIICIYIYMHIKNLLVTKIYMYSKKTRIFKLKI